MSLWCPSLRHALLPPLCLAAVMTMCASLARAHDEPPKTPAELVDAREQQARLAAAGVSERRLYEARDGQSATILLTDTFDAQGRHVGQVVHDPASAQRTRSVYDDAGDWVLDETWRQDRLAERVTFRYDRQHLLTEVLNEDLASGVRERLTYDRDDDPDGVVVTKTRADTLVYTLRFRYEPGSDRTRLVEAVQAGPRGDTLLRTRQTWLDGRRRTKEVFGADGKLAYAFTYDYDARGDLQVVSRSDAGGRIDQRQVHATGPDRLPESVTDRDAEGRVTRVLRYVYERRVASARADTVRPSAP